MSLEIKDIKVDLLNEYENNPRNNDTAVDAVAASIKEFGFKVPIIIDSNNVIVAGHTRLKAAKKLGLKSVPCIIADDLNEEQIKAFRLADNKVGEIAEWDFSKLEEELAGLSMDMLQFGFNEDDFKSEFEEEQEEQTELVEDEAPEVDEENEPIAKQGDIYQLGEHRLICGDSTKAEDVEMLMNGAKADLVFTDPPYGMKKEKDGVLNDNLNYDDLLTFNKKWIPISFDNLKDNGSWYCWGIDEPLMDIYSEILKPMQKANKITFRNLITWNKSYLENGNIFNPFGANGSKGLRQYPIADEKCLFVMSGVQGFNNNADNYFEGWEPIRSYLENEAKKVGLTNTKLKEICGVGMYSHWFTKSQFTLIPKEHYQKLQEYYKGKAFAKPYDEGIKEEYQKVKNQFYDTRAYFINEDKSNNVWNIQITSQKERELTGGHATPKPIALCARAIKSSSRENEIVLDVFGGSGSTLIACEQLNRKCYMCELDSKYVDVIIKRWETLTGKKAIKLN